MAVSAPLPEAAAASVSSTASSPSRRDACDFAGSAYAIFADAMNLALITPDHTELPEVVETTLKISGGADVLTTAFNKRGNLLAGGCSDGRVVVWDFDTYGIARELRGHAGPVTSVSWTRSSRRVLSSADDTLIVWEVLGGVELLRVRLDGPVHHAALHPKMRIDNTNEVTQRYHP